MLEKTTSKFVTVRPYRFMLGLVLGFALGSALVVIFSGSFQPSWLASGILSSMTYGGFALILFGYFYKRNGDKTFIKDFLLGTGIGLILVWFVAAGNGTLSLVNISY